MEGYAVAAMGTASIVWRRLVACGRFFGDQSGVQVVQIDDDEDLPFESGQFDLIINKHESYSVQEVRRILSKGGRFLTQQVGGLDCEEINEKLGVPLNEEFKDWDLETALKEMEKHDFKILKSREECPTQRFYDIGALVYYLKAIPEHFLDKMGLPISRRKSEKWGLYY